MLANAIFTYTLLFVIGSVLGSFCMVVGTRLPQKQSIIQPRSHCDQCGQNLGPVELIPIVSYIIQGGKCKHCQTKLSASYPLGEALMGVAFAAIPFAFQWRNETLVGLTLFCLLFTITVSDMTSYLIPNKILLFFFILVVIERIFIPLPTWWSPILGFVLGFGILYLLALASKGGMGGGDIKLFGLLGIFLGWQGVLLSLFLSSLLGLFFGVGQKIKSGLKSKPLPFGPFIAIGSWLVYFYISGQLANLIYIFTGHYY